MAGVDINGFTPKTYNEIVADLEAQAKLFLGENIDLSEASPVGGFIRAIAKQFALFWQVLEDVYYSGYIETASGESLDRLAALLGIRRKQATKATGIVTFSRSEPATSDIPIPAGTRVATETGIVFKTTEPAILKLGNKSVDVAIEAEEPGAQGNVAANTITVILDPISGIDTVTNPNPTTGGSDKETDEELRYRVITYAPSAAATVYSIKAALLRIDGVTDVSIEEDFGNGQIVITVAGGNDTDIQNTIENTRPAGIRATWQRPTYITIDIEVSVVRLSQYDAATVQNNVQQALSNYINSLPIGEDVVYSDLARAILNAEGVDDIASLSATDGASTISSFGESLQIQANEKAVAGSINVTVV